MELSRVSIELSSRSYRVVWKLSLELALHVLTENNLIVTRGRKVHIVKCPCYCLIAQCTVYYLMFLAIVLLQNKNL